MVIKPNQKAQVEKNGVKYEKNELFFLSCIIFYCLPRSGKKSAHFDPQVEKLIL